MGTINRARCIEISCRAYLANDGDMMIQNDVTLGFDVIRFNFKRIWISYVHVLKSIFYLCRAILIVIDFRSCCRDTWLKVIRCPIVEWARSGMKTTISYRLAKYPPHLEEGIAKYSIKRWISIDFQHYVVKGHKPQLTGAEESTAGDNLLR